MQKNDIRRTAILLVLTLVLGTTALPLSVSRAQSDPVCPVAADGTCDDVADINPSSLVFCEAASDAATGSAATGTAVTIKKFRQTRATTKTIQLSWKGNAPNYKLYQIINKKKKSLGLMLDKNGNTVKKVKIKKLTPGEVYSFRLYAADEEGAIIKDIKPLKLKTAYTKPLKQGGPKIEYWYGASDIAYFSWVSEGSLTGFQFRMETKAGKKIRVKHTKDTYIRINPGRGQTVRVKLRAYIKVGKKKRYGAWSESLVYAVAKEATAYSYHNKITLSKLSVSGTSKKEIYLSTKPNKGYQKIKTLTKESSYTIKKWKGKDIKSDKRYYIRIVYYYKKKGKNVASPIETRNEIHVDKYDNHVGPFVMDDYVV